MEFTHLDIDGMVHMVDVSGKPGTQRIAEASGEIRLQPETIRLLRQEGLPKGNVLTTAKIAGIQAAKQTAGLIPLCHQLNLSWVDIVFDIGDDNIGIRATVRTKESTGVEMEALTAVSVAALTIYDMCKAVDGTMEITGIKLDRKEGGKHHVSTDYRPRTTVLIMSDSIASGKATDRSGAILRNGLEAAGCPVEALQPRFTKRLPGVEQALFQWGQGKVRTAMLSRLAAGMIGSSLVVCLPGSTGAAGDALEVLVPALFHAFPMLHGEGH